MTGPVVYPVARPGVAGTLKASPDGSRLAQCTQFFGPGLETAAALYDFDTATGAITLRQMLSHGNYGCSFSPSSQLLYAADVPPDFFGPAPIYQYDVTVPSPDATAFQVGALPSYASFQLGPDQRIYLSSYGTGNGTGSLAVIFAPDRRVTLLQPNACGFSLNGPSLAGRRTLLGLPNMIDARPAAAGFAFTAAACSQVAFHGPRCGGSFAWSFGDGGTATEKEPVHTFAAPGVYVVELTVTSGAGRSTVRKLVRVGTGPVPGRGGSCGPRLRPVG